MGNEKMSGAMARRKNGARQATLCEHLRGEGC